MLKELLDFANRHAQVVIAALAAIIITGSIAGGLWIQNLQSALDQRDKIHDQRILQLTEANAEERSKINRDLRRSHEANAELSARFQLVEQAAASLEPAYAKLAKAIQELGAKTPHLRTDALIKMEEANSEMGSAVAGVTRALERAQDASRILRTIDLYAGEGGGRPESPSPRSGPQFVGIIGVVLAITILVIAIRVSLLYIRKRKIARKDS
jgi:hypothetical protein